MGVEKDKIKDQYVFQSKRLQQGEKKQNWCYENSKLILINGEIRYALVSDLVIYWFYWLLKKNGCEM